MPHPEVALGICAASETGGVHVLESVTPLAMVPLDEKKEYRIVCVAMLLWRLVWIVTDVPMSNDVLERLGLDAASSYVTVMVHSDHCS